MGHVPGDFRAVSNLTLCTVLSGADGATVGTVEHLLAACRGLGVDNVDIELDGNEVPIMDGSAEPFVEAIEEAGLRDLEAPRRYIKVLRPVQITDGDAVGELFPYNGFRLDVEINFNSPFIGRQRLDIELTPSSFKQKLCRARTFGFMKDVKQLWAAGRALGSSLENTVAIGDDRIMNPEGLRYADEFVRHKTLDAVGDLALRAHDSWLLPFLPRRSSPQFCDAPQPLRKQGCLDDRRSGKSTPLTWHCPSRGSWNSLCDAEFRSRGRLRRLRTWR